MTHVIWHLKYNKSLTENSLSSSAAVKLQATGIPIHLHVVCDCFLPVVAGLSSETF